jgi:radical SAM protein with 4Fe4S-binding SPASM domain
MKYGFDSIKSQNFPSMVQISVTNVCDMACSMCPHSAYVKSKNFDKKYIDFELYKRIADEVGRNHGMIRLLGWGEALQHPELVKMVDYAKMKGVKYINLITNGKALSREISEALIKASLDIIEVSLDAYNEETYLEIRRNKFFNLIKNNIFDFVKIRNQLHANTYVTVGIIDQPKVKNEIEDFKNYWLKHVDDVIVRRFRNFKGHVKEYLIEPEKRSPCRCLWARFNITPEGKVTICYDDWESKYIVGNLTDINSTISNIWQNELFKNYRKAHLEGKAFGLCKDCKDWVASSWSYPYEILLEKVENWKETRNKDNGR